jgi:hypothetical protein
MLIKQGNRCALCKIYINHFHNPTDNDHIIRHADGGETTIENGRVICCGCHRLRALFESYDKKQLIDYHERMKKDHEDAINYLKSTP